MLYFIDTMAKKHNSISTAPVSTRETRSYKRSFEDRVGKPKYATMNTNGPVISRPSNTVTTVSFKRPPMKISAMGPSTAMARDATRVNRKIYTPRDFEMALLRPLIQSMCVSVVVLNQTKLPLNLAIEELEQSVLKMPDLVTRLGATHVRYLFRMETDWRDVSNKLEIVLTVNLDDRPMFMVPGSSRPTNQYKINVHVSEDLMAMIGAGALQFAKVPLLNETIGKKDAMGTYLKNTKSYYKKGINTSKWTTNTWDYQHELSRNIARNFLVAFAGSKAVDIKGLPLFKPSPYGNVEEATGANAARIAQRLSSNSVNAALLDRNIQWIIGRTRAGSKDVSIPYNRLTKFGKWAGTVGNALSVGYITYQISTDTWTASTVVDSGAVVLSLIAALTASVMLAMACTVIAACYAFAELVSGGAVSEWINNIHAFKRNKAYSSPVYSYYTK